MLIDKGKTPRCHCEEAILSERSELKDADEAISIPFRNRDCFPLA